MVRKKKDVNDATLTSGGINLSDLNKEGFALLKDSTLASVGDVIPLGIPEIDKQLDGGIPMGRVIEFFSRENVGKSTIAYQLTRMANLLDQKVVWFDVESTANREHLGEVGVDIDETIVWQPDLSKTTGMSIETIVERMIAIMEDFKKKYDRPLVIVWDSIGASQSTATIEGGMDGKQPGTDAKAITKGMGLLSIAAQQTGSTLIVINQVRDKIGAMSFGPQVDTPGGRALKHAASVRIQLAKLGAYKVGGEDFGHKVQTKLVKSKISVPNSKGESILFGKYGMNELVNTVDAAISLGIIKTQSGGSNGTKVLIPTEDGEVIPYNKDDFMLSIGEYPDEFTDMLKHTFRLVTRHYFPLDYPAIHNNTLDINSIPLMEGLEEYYVQVSEENLEIYEQELDDVKSKLEDSEANISETNEKVKSLRAEVDELTAKVESVKETIKDEKDQATLKSLRDERNDLEGKLKKKTATLTKRQGELPDFMQKHAMLKNKVRDSEKSLSKARDIYDAKHQ